MSKIEVMVLKEIKGCRALCRDGSNCLNHAHDGDYCWLHVQRLYVSG